MLPLNELVCSVVLKSASLVFPTKGWEGHNFINTDPYHKWFATFVEVYKPIGILELGRRNGNSLYSLSYYLEDDNFLDSYDIKRGGEGVVSRPNVKAMVYDGDYGKIDFSKYEFIFVDINGGGDTEFDIFQKIKASGFCGISAWDDVLSSWCPPERFWDKVDLEKYSDEFLHGISGFGIIRHGNRF